MRRSKIVAPMHFVWATNSRLPLITEKSERALYRCLAQQADRLNCELLAIGGMSDHVHIAVMFPATVTFGEFAKQVKGTSSHFMKGHLRLEIPNFWQEGYGVYAFHARLIPRVVAYIENQKEHHANETIWPTLEETDEEATTPEANL